MYKAPHWIDCVTAESQAVKVEHVESTLSRRGTLCEPLLFPVMRLAQLLVRIRCLVHYISFQNKDRGPSRLPVTVKKTQENPLLLS